MNAKILIVDDSRMIRSVLKRSLSLVGVDPGCVTEAENGKEALDLVQDGDFDVVLTDIHMPEMTGVEFIVEARKQPRFANLPIAVISSEHTAERKIQLGQVGVKHFIQKPFTPEDIKRVLVDYLKNAA